MEITLEMIQKYIDDFRTQRDNLTAQIHAVGGAIQILEVLKQRIVQEEE